MGFKGLKNWVMLVLACLVVFCVVFNGCTSSPASTNAPQVNTNNQTRVSTSTSTTASPKASSKPTTSLLGAGASFPAPLYTKWFDKYFVLTGVKVNYQPVGSSAGVTQITNGTVDFGASDGIMTDDQIQLAKAPILHIPMTTGAVAIIYNLQGVASGQLKLTGEVLANIYLKNILNWNDPAIAALNPGVNLPKTPITVVHRSDGSGTTFIFTNYLCKINEEWNTKVGNANSVDWPGDIGGTGSAGVTAQVQQLPNSIGYVEMTYAFQNNLAWASLKNAVGIYVEPSIEGVTAAAEGVFLPDDMKIMITNSSNPQAYPIAGFTWILAYVNQTNQAKGQTLVNMLWWALHDGQQYELPLGYAPLSSAALTKAENMIYQMQYQGQPLKSR